MKFTTILWSLILLFCVTSCTPKDQTTEQEQVSFNTPNDKFEHHVSSYSSGMISSTSPIRFRFATDIVTYDDIGKAAPDNILSFEPALEGVAVWEDRQTIKFIPKEWLKAGQFYNAKANLKEVYPDIAPDLAILDFQFKALEQQFNVEIAGLRENTLTDFSKMRLMGTLQTSDAAIGSAVEQMLSIQQEGNDDFSVTWTHSNGKRTHDFVINNVKTFDEDSKLYLTWNGKSIGVDKTSKDTVTVPNPVFKIISAKVIQEKNESKPYVSVLFSIPLEQVQSIDGLVSIENYRNQDYYGNSNYRYVIDGNELRVYPTRGIEGTKEMLLSAGIRSINKTAIAKPSTWNLSFETLKPAVRLVGKGTIIPKTKNLYFPFEAVKLRGVEVEVFQIYENNVLHFLQGNQLDEEYEYSMKHVGRIVAQKHVSLEALNEESNEFGWKKYSLKLDDLIKGEEGAIYQIRIGFSKKDATCACLDNEATELATIGEEFPKDENGEFSSIMDRYSYDYENKENPCHVAYYDNDQHYKKRNILGSNIGIIAKRGKDKELFVTATNLLTAAPMPNVTIEVFDKVLQRMAKLSTNEDGVIRTKTDFAPQFVVATNGKQKGYLRLNSAESVSLSSFKTSGNYYYKGLKGKLYGERGVWRPGDSLYLTFVLEDKRNEIPAAHPVKFTLTDPRGNVHYSTISNTNTKGMYDFRCKTTEESPTGYWDALVEVGGTSFRESIRIETVKPNRLKVKLDLGKDALKSKDTQLKGSLAVNWLHGAPAGDLRTTVDVRLSEVNTKFEGYKDFEFDDPARSNYYSSPFTLYDAKVDADGKADVNGTIELAKQPAGAMRASFTVRAYEKGGDISADNFSMPYSPYASYVGIQSPKGEYDKSLDLNVNNKIKMVVVDEDGKPLANREVKIGVYNLKWNWWWDNDNEVNNFNSSEHIGAATTTTVKTNSNGEIEWKFRPDKAGRYLIRACDNISKHCSGMTFHAGSAWEDENFNDKTSASMLAFSANKEEYNVGDNVELNVPAGKSGYALLTLENGFGVLDYKWIKLDNQEGIQKITFKTTKDMSPTIYAHITLLQPHQEVENELPIRSYGVIPIKVVDPKSKLEPVLEMADVLSPNSKVQVTVSETSRQPMAYTIAMVDEGLLDLTRFKTPALWDHFYQKEALGVKTWDMFSYVMGAFKLNRILSIGGGGGGDEDGKKANRFKPVVRYVGPFYLKAGQKAVHELEMPNYVGSVRTMIVAAHEGAYGKAEKTTPVRDPLMILGTLPRVLSPNEKVKLPVSLFAMEEHVKEVKIEIKTNALLQVNGATKQTVNFAKTGEKMVEFDLAVAESIGIGKVEIIATSGKEKASYKIELAIRNPNPYSHKTQEMVLQANQQWNTTISPIGMDGTNETRLEVSSIPPIDLARRLGYLIRYPYGCIEQTTSSVFPQLFVDNLMTLDKDKAAEIENNIRNGIKRLQTFQTGLGGFSYWPGDSDASDWGTNYAGHFLLEAQAKGYPVPKQLLANWQRYQKALAKTWREPVYITLPNQSHYRSSNEQESLMQAYRLYTLALAKAPDLAAMNRMRNSKRISNEAKWRLAAAYALAGKKEVAKSIIKGLPTNISPYLELGYTYGSDLRDEAMILETLVALQEYSSAGNLLQQMSKKLSSEQWYATQTLAYSLMAVAKFAGNKKASDKTNFVYQIGAKGKNDAVLSSTPIAQYPIDVESSKERKVWVQNKSTKPLFAKVIQTGQPLIGDTSSTASNLKMVISYQDLDGKKLDPKNLTQGTSFVAIVDIENTGLRGNYEEMALHQVFPSGWEIVNSRMNSAFGSSNNSSFDYQDIRDDRIYTYFDIPQSKKYSYKFYLTAAYQGEYYMPNVSCSAMYDNSVYAQTGGKWVRVTAPQQTAQ